MKAGWRVLFHGGIVKILFYPDGCSLISPNSCLSVYRITISSFRLSLSNEISKNNVIDIRESV